MARKVKLDLEPWELIALDPLYHWCSTCKAMHEFRLDDASNSWYNEACSTRMLTQQLVIEGRLPESRWRGLC